MRSPDGYTSLRRREKVRGKLCTHIPYLRLFYSPLSLEILTANSIVKIQCA
jgi:hypothetical protein